MNALDFARIQFAVTTLFHFIFVPMSIGLSVFVAVLQTRWHRTGDEVWLRATKFWGRFLLISLAIGVVTGIVQEFQFGMNWSIYSKYVGDIFGAPLAMEGLVAFFMESTFIGLWIFGWGRLPKRMHLATIWLTAIGAILSAYFILVANSWMQHPVGYVIDHATGKAHLTNIFAVMFNDTVLLGFPHTILGALTTGGMLVVAVSSLLLLRGKGKDVARRSLRLALPYTLVAVIATGIFGDSQGRLLAKQQPMKMAAAEAVCNTTNGASFSIFSVAGFRTNPCPNDITSIRIPHVLSLIEDLSWNGNIAGIDQVQAAESKQYGPGNYVPPVGVEYWTFRLMIAAGTLMTLIAALGMWLGRNGSSRVFENRRFLKLGLLGVFLPILANWSGWIFTEVGRQPWVVFGLLKTDVANSPNVSELDVILTLAGYIVIYSVLITTGAVLMWREVGHGPGDAPGEQGEGPGQEAADSDLVLAY
ncbi:MAG: cytochrome ubiquinol oxidase subunit I [Solirubrobacteraceae bacterium]